MPKFFVKQNQINNDQINIIEDDVNHIRNVLRMKKDDTIHICNQDTGENFIARINLIEKNNINCKIIEKMDASTESNVQITLFQGLPKFDKMELIIQKNTEVGVCKIVPVIMDRTIVKLDEKDKTRKLERFNKIAEIAAKQSMRDKIPEVTPFIKSKEISNFIDDYDIIIVAYENEHTHMLKQTLKEIHTKENYKIGIVIGPEGGISEKEIEMFEGLNFKLISLGKRILRTETAGLVLASNIIYELEEG